MWEQHEVELERKIAKLEAQQKDFYEAAKKVKLIILHIIFIFSYMNMKIAKRSLKHYNEVNFVFIKVNLRSKYSRLNSMNIEGGAILDLALYSYYSVASS